MRTLPVAFGFGILALCGSADSDRVSFSVPAQAQTRPALNTPAWETMWRQCRIAVFRKYGQRQPERPGKIVMNSDDAVRLTDACMANGGRVS